MLRSESASPRIMRHGNNLKRSASTTPINCKNNIIDLTSPRMGDSSPIFVGQKKRARSKRVAFTNEEPKVYHFDPHNGHGAPEGDNGINHGERKSQLTEELTLLSTLHGRARRQLRDLSKHDLKTVVKYGVKTRGRIVNGDQRWMFEYGNTIVITDNSCQREITSYNKAISIERATITEQIRKNHNEVARILREDPHMCTTHSIIIIDQSGSMKTCDVNCFRSRSDASYGTLALDYIAEQLYQMGDEYSVDAVTIIEMKDEGTLFIDKEPLDWILFNRVIDRISTACPQSHGNYVNSLAVAEHVINRERELFSELDADDMPAFMLLFISDGRPSDSSPEQQEQRLNIVSRLARKLASKLTFVGMGVGASGADFEQLQFLVERAIECGAEGQFNHAGLNPANLSTTFSSIATSMTTTRNDLCSVTGARMSKTEKRYIMKKKEDSEEYGLAPFRRETNSVCRYVFSPGCQPDYDWKEVKFLNRGATGFDVDNDPFGKGAERLAYMFQEIKPKKNGMGWDKVGEQLVAKESRFIEDERSKEKFHLYFCRVQMKAQEQAKLFNEAVKKAPMLKPSDDALSLPPPITFLDCSIYEYSNYADERCGLLVEKYLKGKFTKFNSNNGFIHNHDPDGASIQLVVGEVLLTDFVQAFSHWVYESTNRDLLVCDLQGILDMEGLRPAFRLTDAAICSKSRGKRSHYGKTDLGMRGIRHFCRRHVCNGVCTALNLPPTMGKYSYNQLK